MKTFDLEKALAGDPVITRDGRPVTQLTFFENARGDTFAGVLDGVIELWAENGEYNHSYSSNFDLFMAPKTRQGWICVYQGLDGEYFTRPAIFPSPEAVKDRWPESAPVRIEWEEE